MHIIMPAQETSHFGHMTERSFSHDFGETFSREFEDEPSSRPMNNQCRAGRRQLCKTTTTTTTTRRPKRAFFRKPDDVEVDDENALHTHTHTIVVHYSDAAGRHWKIRSRYYDKSHRNALGGWVRQIIYLERLASRPTYCIK